MRKIGWRQLEPHEAERFSYSWIVLLSSFLLRLVVFGQLFSIGILYVHWLEEFGKPRGETAWIGSIATGTTLMMGPFAAMACERFTMRRVVMAAALVSSLAVMLSYLATTIYFLIATFGIVAGVSGGIINFGAVLALEKYFSSKRPLAMGIGSAGTGIGTLIYGFLLEFLIDKYSWRESLLILGAIQLNMIVCGALLVEPTTHNLRKLNSVNVVPPPTSAPHKIENSKEDSTGESSVTSSNESSPASSVVMEKLKERNGDVIDDNDNSERYSTGESSVTSSNEPSPASSVVMEKLKERNGDVIDDVGEYKIDVVAPEEKEKAPRLADAAMRIIKEPIFLCLFLCDFFSWLVQYVPYVHIPARAKELDIPQSAFLVSSMGLTAALGKAFFGILTTLYRSKAFGIYTSAQFLFALSVMLSPFCVRIWSLTLFSIAFGFLSGSYIIMMVIPSDLLGKSSFSLSYGMLLFGEGVGVYLGPPIVGWLSDRWHSYGSSLLAAGLVLFMSFLSLLPIYYFKKRRLNSVGSLQAS